jgi:RNA polymerase sigma-70 factor (ECF subfamily)
VSSTELVLSLSRGSTPAFESLYDEYGSRLYSFFLCHTGNATLAEDLVQGLFERFARYRSGFADVKDLEAYVFRCAHNLLKSERKRIARARKVFSASESLDLFEAPAPPEPSEETERTGKLSRCLGLLPLEQSEVVQLKIWGKLTFAQIADALKINPNSAASRYRYALEKLRAWMEE